MKTINFFISENELPQQNIASNYGSISSNQYRVTSLFNGSVSGTEPMAYAVTSGKVFIVQQINNANRVNLLLRPDKQPTGAPSVKYFVYRGLLKDDFLDASTSYTTIKPAASNDSKLISKIRKGTDSLKALELYTSLADVFFVDDLFIKNDNQFATVEKGDSIGRFNTISSLLDYGFEIMLNESCYSPNLNIARLDVNIIDILSGSNGEDETSRLKTLAYLDPAAYFGFFSHKDFSIKTNNSNTPTQRSKDEVYELVKKFATKNTVYIDLRDKYGHPLDWFTSNPQTVKITSDGSSANTSSDFPYRNTNNYPIHCLNSGFLNVQSNSNQSYFIITLSLSTANNNTPLFVLHNGYWLDNLPEYKPDNLFSKKTDLIGWTDDEKLAIFSANDSGANVPISTYIRLQYTEYQNASAFNTNLPSGNFYEPELIPFNALFSPNAMRAPDYNDITITNNPILNV